MNGSMTNHEVHSSGNVILRNSMLRVVLRFGDVRKNELSNFSIQKHSTFLEALALSWVNCSERNIDVESFEQFRKPFQGSVGHVSPALKANENGISASAKDINDEEQSLDQIPTGQCEACDDRSACWP